MDALALAFDRQTKALEELKEAARLVAMEGPRTKVRESLTLPGLSSRAASQVTEVSLLRLSRPVAACPRCHNANQQCDGKLPACTNCKSSGLAAQCAADSKLLGESEGKNLGPTASAPGPDTIIGTPQNGLTARVGNMALSINWNVSYEKGDPGTTASSWLQYVVSIYLTSSTYNTCLPSFDQGSKFLPAPSSSADHDVQINTQRTARVRIKITSDDGKPLVREITCPSIMTRAEFFRRVSSILERQKSMNEKLDEIAAIISDGHNTLSGKDRRRMETSINAHLLRHHASMFGENQGDGTSRAYIVSTSRDTNWYLETKDITPHWQRVNYLNAAIHIPGLIFLYLSPPRRLAILLPWSSIQTRLCHKYDICTHQQRIAALNGGFEAHDFFMLWLVAYIAFQIWFYTINRNFYIHGTGYEFNIMLAPALYERVVNYHVNLMLMLFAIWDLGEEMWESIQTVYEELSCGRLTSSVLRASTLKLVGYISGITVLGVLVYYAQLWMEGLTILAVLIWSVLAYVFLVTLWEQRGLDVLRQWNKISGWLS